MRTRRKYPTVCHPGRPHVALGLCGPCRQYWTKVVHNGASGDRADQLRPIVESHESRRTDVAVQWKQESKKQKRESPDHYTKSRTRWLKTRYGLTLDEYERMLAQQDGKCEICENPPVSQHLYVDHCHKTKRVRGLLCAKCNSMMSVIDAGPYVLMRLLKYAEKYNDARKED